PEAELDSAERRLPDVSEGDRLVARSVSPDGHATKPPPRFTEATLVRELEEREIGRPSTYASIIRTIIGREYVYKKGTQLVPTWLAFAVVRLLEQHFGHLVDYGFTASMEEALDKIATGDAEMRTWLSRFYFGNGEAGLKDLVSALGDIDARELSTFPIRGDNGEANGLVVRVGRYGPYLEDADGNRGNVPDDLPPDELTPEKARELLARGSGDRELGTDPETGH